MVEDFKDHPISLAEIRSDKTMNAADWSPRDALIRLLRRIDSGEDAVTALVISYRYEDKDAPGGQGLGWTAATANKLETLGLLSYAQVAVQAP